MFLLTIFVGGAAIFAALATIPFLGYFGYAEVLMGAAAGLLAALGFVVLI